MWLHDVAIEELRLSYHGTETTCGTACPCYGDLAYFP